VIADKRCCAGLLYRASPRLPRGDCGEASRGALAEASTVPYATILPHLNPLASRAAAARDHPRASLVPWIDEATAAGFRGSLCDGGCARPAARQAQR
jgi:hypothetical protein